MKPLRVDLSTRAPTALWAARIAAAAALLVAVTQIASALQGRTTLQALEADVASARSRAAGRAAGAQPARPESAAPKYADDAARLARIAEFDLGAVLAAVESARVPAIKVVSMELSAPDRTVRLEIEAPDHTTTLAYVVALNAGGNTFEWQLGRTQPAPAGGLLARVDARRAAGR